MTPPVVDTDALTELIKQLPAILGAIAGIVASVLAFLSWKRGAENKAEIAATQKSVEKVHDLVNGKSGIQEQKLDAALGEVVALKQVLAAKPGATTEEQVRAIVATEQQQRAVTLAAAKPEPPLVVP